MLGWAQSQIPLTIRSDAPPRAVEASALSTLHAASCSASRRLLLGGAIATPTKPHAELLEQLPSLMFILLLPGGQATHRAAAADRNHAAGNYS